MSPGSILANLNAQRQFLSTSSNELEKEKTQKVEQNNKLKLDIKNITNAVLSCANKLEGKVHDSIDLNVRMRLCDNKAKLENKSAMIHNALKNCKNVDEKAEFRLKGYELKLQRSGFFANIIHGNRYKRETNEAKRFFSTDGASVTPELLKDILINTDATINKFREFTDAYDSLEDLKTKQENTGKEIEAIESKIKDIESEIKDIESKIKETEHQHELAVMFGELEKDVDKPSEACEALNVRLLNSPQTKKVVDQIVTQRKDRMIAKLIDNVTSSISEEKYQIYANSSSHLAVMPNTKEIKKEITELVNNMMAYKSRSHFIEGEVVSRQNAESHKAKSTLRHEYSLLKLRSNSSIRNEVKAECARVREHDTQGVVFGPDYWD